MLVVGLSVWHAFEASQHLLTDRDPGVHVTTARWLAREATLLVEPAVGPFAERPGLVFEEQGWNLNDDGRLEPQFLHLLPVVLAAAQRVGGDRLLLVAPTAVAGIALLAFSAFARRVVRPWWALTATAALAVSLPWVHVSRDAFSEPLVVLLLFAGLTALWDAATTGSWRRAGIAGLLLGGVAMARVEGFVALLPLVGWSAVALAGAQRKAAVQRRTSTRLVAAFLCGLAATVGLAVADLARFATWYLDDLRGLLTAVGAGLAAVALAGAGFVVASALRRRRAPVAPHAAGPAAAEAPPAQTRARRALGWAAAGGVVAVAGAAWVVRPLVSTVTGAPSGAIAALEGQEGLVVEGVRRYSEHSVQWLGWYLGPLALLLGFAGLAIVARRLVADPDRDLRLLPFIAVFGTISALYLWRPSIVPDQVWAMRRYTIVTIPGLLLLAGLAGQALVDRVRATAQAAAGAVAGLAVASALVVFPITTLVPVAGATTQEGLLGKVEDVCAAVGEDGAVVVVAGQALELTFGQTIRSFCGVPVAIAEPSFGAADVAELAVAWAEGGRDLHLVGADAAQVEALAGRPPELVSVLANDDQLEATLTRRPDKLVARPLAFAVADASPAPG